MIGQWLLHYEITEKLGEGGMGVVYKARDTHLDRFVAIKVLPPERVADAERKRRFVQEAKAASALNHPNIITIYDIAADAGHDFIAMECVGGKTLNQLISRKGMRLNDALMIAVQIADALSRAHAAGIIHRDVKPANIMVDEHGLVKVLDFGVAKLAERGASENDSTVTLGVKTDAGTTVGTAAYMSPEQAEGRPVDARSDIFSFGSVLYEMITGRRAFCGETRLSTLSAILRDEPAQLGAMGEGTPADLAKLVGRCLRKDPARRIQHMGDVKLALEELKEGSELGQLPAAVPRRRGVPRWAAAVLVVLAAGGAVTWRLTRATKLAEGPTFTRMTSDSGYTTDPALSPDGKLLAYASDRSGDGNLDIWVQQVAGGEPIRLTRNPADDLEPAFSPDGSRIAFRSDREGGGIYVMPGLGGEARLIAKYGQRPRFSPDDKWIAYWVGLRGTGDPVASGSARCYVVASTGGQPRQIRPEFAVAAEPIWAPDGKHLLIYGRASAAATNSDRADWWVTPLEDGPAVSTGALEIFRREHFPPYIFPWVWLPDGRVLFSANLADSRDLWQLSIEPGTWKAADPPARITNGTGLSDQPSASIARDSGGRSLVRVAFSALSQNIQIWSLPLDANRGQVAGELQQVTYNLAWTQFGSLSADGKKLVFARSNGGNEDIWINELPSGHETDLTPSPGNQFHPRISADGSKVVYNEIKDGKDLLYTLSLSSAADGTLRPGVPQKLCEDCGWPWNWSRDGTKVLFRPAEPGLRHISVIDVTSGQKTRLISSQQLNLYQANFSPDDRWVAFLASSSQYSQLFIAPFRLAPTPVSDSIPSDWIAATSQEFKVDKPRWSPDGNLLYFISDRDGFRCLWAQRLDPPNKRPVGPPFAVYHLHSARRSLANVGLAILEPSVIRNKIVFNLAENTGNIWTTEIKP